MASFGVYSKVVALNFAALAISCTEQTIKHLGPYSPNILKGGYFDFSHLTELKNIYITEIYMKKQYKSSIIKNHKITNKKKNLMGFP